MQKGVADVLKMAWWNVNNFYHFRPEEVRKRPSKKTRWPQSREEYDHKCKRVDAALLEFFKKSGIPQVIGLGEITSEAAEQLRQRLLPAYRLTSLDVKADEPTLQVAVLYPHDTPGLHFVEQPPILVPRTPRGTRPMAVIDAKVNGDHTIRIIVCHWQARMDEKGSKKLRFRTADYLSGYTYDFVNERPGLNHIAIVGDLNEEPFEDNLDVLNAHRHRARSQGIGHWADDDVKRTHLYNTSWRLLGEKFSYPESAVVPVDDNCAGTYYWEVEKSWRHFDQLIVSGGLLQPKRPFIDESETTIVSSPAFLTDGLPLKFSRDGPKFRGLSDHLPLFAQIHI